MKINKHILPNGLKLVHYFDPTTSMVAINVLYDVGAKDENHQKTGFAHLFEHLMFGGSVNIPDYDTPLQQAGGENNAWTNNDMTCYYLTVPNQNVETGFWLESDRMLSLAFSKKSLEVQKKVVIEEFKQTTLNQPYGDIQHIVREQVYQVHPYQWPTIGKDISHIESATLSDVKDFFFHHYAPNNAILSVTGNISFEETVRLTEKWFGPIERREVFKRSLPVEPKQIKPIFNEVERNVPADAIYKTYRICNRMNPDYYVFDMLSDLLASGRSSRLYQHLVMKNHLFSEINAYISGEIEPGTIHISGKPAPGISMQTADQAIVTEINLLCEELINDRELEKVKNKFESNDLFSNISYLNKATNLAIFELLGDAGMIYTEVEKYRKVTASDIQRVAKEVFNPNNCCTLYYRKSGSNQI